MQVVAFTDGGARGNPGSAAIGGLIKTRLGDTTYSFSKFIGVATNNEAEYLALIHVLEWLRDNVVSSKITECTFKLDSMLVVQQVAKKWKIKEPRLQIHAQTCWQLLEKIQLPYSLLHVPRAQNAEADALVNAALDIAR